MKLALPNSFKVILLNSRLSTSFGCDFNWDLYAESVIYFKDVGCSLLDVIVPASCLSYIFPLRLI